MDIFKSNTEIEAEAEKAGLELALLKRPEPVLAQRAALEFEKERDDRLLDKLCDMLLDSGVTRESDLSEETIRNILKFQFRDYVNALLVADGKRGERAFVQRMALENIQKEMKVRLHGVALVSASEMLNTEQESDDPRIFEAARTLYMKRKSPVFRDIWMSLEATLARDYGVSRQEMRNRLKLIYRKIRREETQAFAPLR